MIILNYKEYTKKLLENGFAKFPNVRDMLIIAKSMVEKHAKNVEIYDFLIDFCKKWDKHINIAKISNKIQFALKDISKPLPILCENIKFYKSEIDFIKSIKDYDLQKVLFIIMSIAKTKNINYVYLNGTSAIRLKDIFELANVNISKAKQELALHELYACGAITPTYGLRYSINCLSRDTDNVVIFEFAPTTQMVLQYELYCGKAIYCQKCGTLVHKNNNKMKYCKECATEIKLKKDKERITASRK
jgi:hypothetical protein